MGLMPMWDKDGTINPFNTSELFIGRDTRLIKCARQTFHDFPRRSLMSAAQYYSYTSEIPKDMEVIHASPLISR